MVIKIGVAGATGRVGQNIVRTVTDRDEMDIAFAISPSPEKGPIGGQELVHHDQFKQALRNHAPSVLIDFSVPSASLGYINKASKEGVPIVTGTTGFSPPQLDELRKYSESTPIMKSDNFSRGLHLLAGSIEDMGAALKSYDTEIIESHHKNKLDAPSGTAKYLADIIEEFAIREDSPRKGDDARDSARGEGIDIHSIRAGEITSVHEILFANEGEEIRMIHRVESPMVYVNGALAAADWITDRGPGLYDFADSLE